MTSLEVGKEAGSVLSARECVLACAWGRLAQVRPAVALPVVDHAQPLGEALEGDILTRLARPRLRLPQPVEVGIGQAAVAVLVQVERAPRFAQLQQQGG